MKYIRANNEGIINLVTVEPINNATCTVDFLPDDFYVYLSEGKYRANENGIYIVDGWVDYTESEWIDRNNAIENGEVWVRNKVPTTITTRQGMLLLSRRKQLNIVEGTIYNLATITGDVQLEEGAIIEWNKASTWDRTHATVLFIADLLQWDDEQIDTFFVEASKI